MAFKMRSSPMARNYGAPFNKAPGTDHKGEDHSHREDDPSESKPKYEILQAEREANIAKIKADKKARYDSEGTAIFERPYDHPGEAIAVMGMAPLTAGAAGLAIPHAATAANLGKTLLAAESGIVGGVVSGDTKQKRKHRKK